MRLSYLGTAGIKDCITIQSGLEWSSSYSISISLWQYIRMVSKELPFIKLQTYEIKEEHDRLSIKNFEVVPSTN